MKINKLAGRLLMIGAAGVFIPYLILTFIFQYPQILRADPGQILLQFHKGGTPLILVWLSFALLCLPLLMGYIVVGKILAHKHPLMTIATSFGVVSGFLQMIGLLRWSFVVPLLAKQYAAAETVTTKLVIEQNFMLIHQFGGVLLGEHLGQLLTIIWTLLVAYVLVKSQVIGRGVYLFGIIASIIYLIAQAELLATIIPGFPHWELAGLLGSTLWLIWLLVIGFLFIRSPQPLKL